MVQKWKPLLKTLDFDPWEVDEDDTLILGFEMFAELGAHVRMGKLSGPYVLGYGCEAGSAQTGVCGGHGVIRCGWRGAVLVRENIRVRAMGASGRGDSCMALGCGCGFERCEFEADDNPRSRRPVSLQPPACGFQLRCSTLTLLACTHDRHLHRQARALLARDPRQVRGLELRV